MKNIREKDSYQYRIEAVDGKEHITVSFVDGMGRENEVSVSRKLFLSLQELRRDENRQAYATERYVSHFIDGDGDDDINSVAFYPLPTTETEVIRSAEADQFMKTLGTLTDKQRRRFIMYRLDEMTYAQIAADEQCSLLSVYASVKDAEKKIRKKYKNFCGEG